MVTKISSKPTKHSFLFAGLCLLAAGLVLAIAWGIRSIHNFDYIVQTNVPFAPFEFYDGAEIKGVDVEIIHRVADKLHKKIKITNVDFSVIVDNVSIGRIADAGAAGLTITPARSEKADFSIPYYTSSQYLIYAKSSAPTTREGHVVFDALAGKTIGTQTDTTGYLFTNDEIEKGSLRGTDTRLKGFESAQLAADGIAAGLVDYVVVDELPAEYIVAKNPTLACLPLYYSGATADPTHPEASNHPDYPAEESYAIAVNKNRPELLNAINETLSEMLKKDASGVSEIDHLVVKYMGL